MRPQLKDGGFKSQTGFGWVQVPVHGFKSQSALHSFNTFPNVFSDSCVQSPVFLTPLDDSPRDLNLHTIHTIMSQ